MAFYDLEASITEEDLSGTSRKARQPLFLYIEAETDAGIVELKGALRQFLNDILQTPTLQASVDVEICVFGQNGCTMLKECGPVTSAELPGLSQAHPTYRQNVALAPVLEKALERIAAQKAKYRENRISYGMTSLLVFTAGNIADEPWRLREAASRALRETSVNILPVCQNEENALLGEISSQGKVLQLPLQQAYTVAFQQICNSMERLSRSTSATYQELTSCLVDGAQYFK